MAFRFAPGRPPAVAAEAMVATSQPLATRAGLRALEQGGNAVDAAVAAAAVLAVTEPMATGIGGDAFALVWDGDRLHGLDGGGPAPAAAEPAAPVEERGPRSVTVPGAVAGWAALVERFGRLGLDALLADAIAAAEDGFAVGRVTAAGWTLPPAPRPAERVRSPELGATLRRIAEEGPTAFYRGDVARAIASCTWLDEEDLAGYEPAWVDPIELDYRGVTVCELPPPTQGVAALEALGLLRLGDPTLPAQVECARLALEDALAYIRDGARVAWLLEEERLRERRTHAAASATEPAGGTVYLCVVDRERTAVSFIQSLFGSFGSGIVAPGTGVVLQNRGACFRVNGAVEPGKRPYHTLIPGMLFRNGRLFGPFGVMGGFLQAQAHMQLVSAFVDEELDPQEALDRPRFRVEGATVRLEEGLWERAGELRGSRLEIVRSSDQGEFGGGQAVLVEGDVLVGGSDARKDGYAAGF